MLGLAQWADLGMYLQSVMLLRAEGLHSCPQMAWSQVHNTTVAEIVEPADELMLLCSMSIGHDDFTVDDVRTGRAQLDETVTFIHD